LTSSPEDDNDDYDDHYQQHEDSDDDSDDYCIAVADAACTSADCFYSNGRIIASHKLTN